MANVSRSGSIFVDTTGSLISKRVKVSYILFTVDNAGESLLLYDHASTNSNQKLAIYNATANETKFLDFSNKPLLFQDGVYATISAGCTATLVLTDSGD